MIYYKYRGWVAASIALLALTLSSGVSLPRFMVAVVLLGLGLYWRHWARSLIGAHSRGDQHECYELIASGAYGHCRHPLYVSSWWVGSAWLLLQNWEQQWRFALLLFLWTAHLVALSVMEDRFLKNKFGSVWQEYAAQVVFWRFVPRFQKLKWNWSQDFWTWVWLFIAFALPILLDLGGHVAL